MEDSEELTGSGVEPQNHVQLNTSDPPDERFEIPELPSGRSIDLVLLESWGDPYFVGLAAIEIFTDEGLRITMDDTERVSHPTVLKIIKFGLVPYPDKQQCDRVQWRS